MRISFGKADTSLKEYGIIQAPLLYNDQPSGYKAIIKNGKLVAVLGSGYKALPNKVALEIANEIADEVGAVPFKKFYQNKHVAFSSEGTRMYATYIVDVPYDIEGRDNARIGFTIQNSIDGTLAFSASGFTFREFCENGVFIGLKKLSYYYRKHTKNFEVKKEAIARNIRSVIDDMKRVIEEYRKLVQLRLNREIAQKIAEQKFLSKKLMPDYILIGKNRELLEFKEVDLWTVYNDLSARIWHNPKTGLDSKRAQFQALHKVIPIRV